MRNFGGKSRLVWQVSHIEKSGYNKTADLATMDSDLKIYVVGRSLDSWRLPLITDDLRALAAKFSCK